nr:MAG TPA: hypothetical protein [Caudoviricetes sp.]
MPWIRKKRWKKSKSVWRWANRPMSTKRRRL